MFSENVDAGLVGSYSVNLQNAFSYSFPSGLVECVYTPVMSVSNGFLFPEANAIITPQHVLNRLLYSTVEQSFNPLKSQEKNK